MKLLLINFGTYKSTSMDPKDNEKEKNHITSVILSTFRLKKYLCRTKELVVTGVIPVPLCNFSRYVTDIVSETLFTYSVIS